MFVILFFLIRHALTKSQSNCAIALLFAPNTPSVPEILVMEMPVVVHTHAINVGLVYHCGSVLVLFVGGSVVGEEMQGLLFREKRWPTLYGV